MMSIKCPQCGLVNFASPPECKRCHYEFAAAAAGSARAEAQPVTIAPSQQPPPVQNSSQPTQPPKTFTILPVFEPVATPIGGWLIVFAFLMGLSLALSAYAIEESISMYSTNVYKVLTTESSLLYISGFSSWFTFELIWNCFLVLSLTILFIRFFRKSKSFPNLMIALLGLSILVEGFGYLTVRTFAKELTQKLGSVVHNAQVPEIFPSYFGLIILLALGLSVLWIWYFLTSRRVETTFVY
jgi:hypothetical protein